MNRAQFAATTSAFALASALVASTASAKSPLDSLFGLFGGGNAGGDSAATLGSLDAATAADGLREALRVGTERATASTSSMDGFLGNALIRIAMPEQLTTMTNALRTVGLGAKVDEMEVAMNRAAEQAAGEAKGVFWEAISTMTLDDAMGVLNGGETAATDYFRTRTSESLREKFSPIVTEKMQTVGLYNAYEPMVERYNALPFVTAPAVDLETHVTDGALDGLFTVLADEERKIREDPVARTSDILKRVFGQ